MKSVVIIVGGPSGCGKTTTGQCIAARLGCAFEEGDAYHSKENVAKMQRGEPLTDDDRRPWLLALRTDVIEKYSAAGRSVVLACSALQRKYRDLLRGAASPPVEQDSVVFFVVLALPYDALVQRVQQREGHYMPASLVRSQVALLEPLDPQLEQGVQLDCTGRSAAQLAEMAVTLLPDTL
ncbi:gluconokinase [Strigomonas culicis]|nr:gluconokinase [Strigomonas culicis]|eukprot:EPY37268.1 gluconokinase [Strigomonas culicis]